MKNEVRNAALISLERIEKSKKYSNLEIDAAIKKYNFTDIDRAFFTALVYGVIQRRITLDYFIAQFSNKPIGKIDPTVLQILRLGLYQIMFMDKVPNSAACDESVKLCRMNGYTSASGFVNAILRNACRNELIYPNLSVKHSCPEWLCRMWTEQYGAETAEKLLESVNTTPDITLRVNTLKITRDEIKGTKTKLSPFGIKVFSLPEFDGSFFIQDEASQICCIMSGAKEGETVIDVCASPGGKSFSCAMQMNNKGRIISCDLHKLSLIEKSADMLGIKIIETRQIDGTVFNPEFENIADLVICDVPCSGLGVIAKKPEIRYKTEEEISKLPELQYTILNNSSRYVKNGGRIVYSTCTLNTAENEDVVKHFIESNSNFKVMEERTLFPCDDNTDGFYIALLQNFILY
ncbi:MAG: 16S rRNA (cytosine(967)-C(5))-methyltransferase RsmB [Oscillospiraceae bacterium]|nr:16S rRNA (cytosine(967)-C(5))-methyltransferase RsmB [Oscillospiraceae bacterium]